MADLYQAHDGREVPISDLSMCSNMCDLLDHLIGAGEQRWGNGQPECPGGPEIDYKLELRRLLHWQVAGLLAAEDAIDVRCRLPGLLSGINAVRHEFRRPRRKNETHKC